MTPTEAKTRGIGDALLPPDASDPPKSESFWRSVEGWRKLAFAIFVVVMSFVSLETIQTYVGLATGGAPIFNTSSKLPDGWVQLVTIVTGLFMGGNVAQHYVENKHGNGDA